MHSCILGWIPRSTARLALELLAGENLSLFPITTGRFCPEVEVPYIAVHFRCLDGFSGTVLLATFETVATQSQSKFAWISSSGSVICSSPCHSSSYLQMLGYFPRSLNISQTLTNLRELNHRLIEYGLAIVTLAILIPLAAHLLSESRPTILKFGM